jgi:hypothetical protein
MKRFLRMLLPSFLLATMATPLIGVGVASAAAHMTDVQGPGTGTVGVAIPGSAISTISNGSGSLTVSFYLSGPSSSPPAAPCASTMALLSTVTGSAPVSSSIGFTPGSAGNYWLYASATNGEQSSCSPTPGANEEIVVKATQAALLITPTTATYTGSVTV